MQTPSPDSNPVILPHDIVGPVSRPRAIDVPGLVNARDLGGLPRRQGGTTPTGVFCRSESIDRVDTDGWEALWRLGIRSVVDLREDDERDGDRGRRPDWLTTIPVAVDGNENTEFWTDYIDSGRAGTAMYYLPHLAAMPERTGAALAAIVDAPAGGVLFHCAAGRDRTGLIAMLLLSAVDVEPESIVTDYLETVRLGATRAAALGREDNEPRIDAHLQTLGTTTEQAFTDALAGLDLDAFLDHSGLDDAQRRALSTWRGNLPA